MDISGIAAASMAISQSQLLEAVYVSTTKKAMDTQGMQAAALLEMLPPSQHMLDIYI